MEEELTLLPRETEEVPVPPFRAYPHSHRSSDAREGLAGEGHLGYPAASMPGKGHISSRVLRPAILGMRVDGSDADGALLSVGLEPTAVLEPNGWIEREAMLKIWALAAQQGPPQFALRNLERANFNFLAQIEAVTEYLPMQLLISSATVGEGLEQFERYTPLTFADERFIRVPDAGGLLLRFEAASLHELQEDFVTWVSLYPLRALQQTAAGPVLATDVFFVTPAPVSLELHQRLFGSATLHFASPIAGFRLSNAVLALPLSSARPSLARELRTRSDSQLAELAESGPIAVKVRELIRSGARSGVPTAESVAGRLGLSLRTMSRRLEGEGTSYRALSHEARASIARDLLAENRFTVAEIAEKLGFSDTSSFQRAFRRWYGVAPTRYRAPKE